MIDSGADHSVIKEGIFPTKYYESTNEKLVTANNSPLRVMGKITKLSICNENICFKHQFIIVNDLNTDVILGIPFLTQIYPFWINSNGLGTNIMGQKILFKFITPVGFKDLSTLQTNSIYSSVNFIQSVHTPIDKQEKVHPSLGIPHTVHSSFYIPCTVHSSLCIPHEVHPSFCTVYSSLCIPHAFIIVETNASKHKQAIISIPSFGNSLPNSSTNRFMMNTDKGKSPIQKTVYSKDYEIKISSLSTSPIQSPNRFQVLGNFPPLPYAMTSPSPSSKFQSTSKTSDSSPYFAKKNRDHLLLTTFNEVPDYKTLTSFINKILPLGCQWIPDDPLKNQRYYELVLVDSGSIELYHTMDKHNPNQISYSKCVIKRLIKPSEWASLSTTKDFTVNYIPKGYSYHDYRMAWYRAFLYRPFDHSWFFTFHSNCQEEFPIWFYEWWHSYGPTTDILPSTVLKGFNIYLLKARGLHYEKTVQFYREFKVPWILCWSYQIAQHYSATDKFPMSLFREFKIKWWDKFNQTICSDTAVTEFITTGKRLQY